MAKEEKAVKREELKEQWETGEKESNREIKINKREESRKIEREE